MLLADCVSPDVTRGYGNGVEQSCDILSACGGRKVVSSHLKFYSNDSYSSVSSFDRVSIHVFGKSR